MRLGILKIKIHFEVRSRPRFFLLLHVLFDSGACLPFNRGNKMNLKKSNDKPRKIKFEPEKFLRFFLKNKSSRPI